MLHDIGDYVRYDGHHKHSYYLIQHSDIMGLTPDERAIVANVARYHRKSPPDPVAPELPRPRQGRAREGAGLAAILRIADALDREHLGKVKSVRADEIDGKGRKMNLVIAGDEERELEEWTVRAKSELLRRRLRSRRRQSQAPQRRRGPQRGSLLQRRQACRLRRPNGR